MEQIEDKNNVTVSFTWKIKFIDWINLSGLLEVHSTSIRFTCTNNQVVPIMANVDRILVSTFRESQFPTTIMSTLATPGSDHAPLLLTVVGITHINKPFRF
jgi:endonuclease/exonuclease/phosphatase family metal-dependent hydrolase